jgi:ABC-type transport system substrate-binding protein
MKMKVSKSAITKVQAVVIAAIVLVASSAAVATYLMLPPSGPSTESLTGPDYGGTLIHATSWVPASFNPGTPMVLINFEPMHAVLGQLVQYGKHYCFAERITPYIAQSWDVSSDGKVWTFYLVENATFHCGRPVNAEAIKYLFDAAVEEEWAYWTGIIPFWDRCEVTDEYTVKCYFNTPFPAFLQTIASPLGFATACPYHRELWGDDFATPRAGYGPGEFGACGCGPFIATEWVEGSHLLMEANENFFAGRPWLDNFKMRFILDTAVIQIEQEMQRIHTQPDWLAGGEALSHLQTIPWLQFDTTLEPEIDPPPSLGHDTFYLNPYKIQLEDGEVVWEDNWPMSSIKFRKALLMMLNFRELVPITLLTSTNYYSNSWLALAGPNYYTAEFAEAMEEVLPPYDPEGARELIAEVWAERSWTRPLRFIGYPEMRSPYRYNLWAELLASELAKCDPPINCEIDILEQAIWLTELDKWNFDVACDSGARGMLDVCLNWVRGMQNSTSMFILPNGTRVQGSGLGPLVAQFDEEQQRISTMFPGPEKYEAVQELELEMASLYVHRTWTGALRMLIYPEWVHGVTAHGNNHLPLWAPWIDEERHHVWIDREYWVDPDGTPYP